jgi:cell division protein FtsB
MARITISDLQAQNENLTAQLQTQQQINRELRDEVSKLRSLAEIARSILEKAVR